MCNTSIWRNSKIQKRVENYEKIRKMKLLKLKIGFLTMACASMFLVSCGGKEEEENISLPDPPTDIKYNAVQLIDGPLSGYIEVVPGQYVLELEKNEDEFLLGYSGKMKVKFRFLKSMDVKAGTGYNNYGPSLLGKALDDQGAPLEFDLDINADKDLATYLKRGSGEEWLTLTISGQGSCENADEAAKQLEKYKKGKQIRFNSEIVEEKFDSESSSSSSSSSVSSSNSSDNCDEFLKGYEEFMNKYIAIAKKMKNNPNDMSIMSDYTSMMTEASEWAEKTADCAADAKFTSKFAAIQMKIANAASKM
jgi:hypothetical protein